jgi:hypothetical protein
MPSTYTSSLRLTLQATGENSGSWGTIVNNGVTSLVDSSVAGTATVTHDNTANYTLSTANGATDEARQMFLNITGTLTAARNVVCPTASKLYFLRNNTTGGFAVTLKTSAGTGISVPSGKYAALYCDGTNVVNAFDYQSTLTANTATNLAGGAAGSVPYQTSAGTTTMLAAGTNGQVLTLAGGVPTWAASSGGVTSFSAGTTGLTPNTTTTGAITLAGTLDVDNGGTGQTTYTDGQLLIGNSTGNTLAKSTLTAGSGISITNGAGSITIATSGGGGTVTSVTGTAPVASSGGATPAISLNAAYGDTLNPYASKTANFFLAAPNGSAAAPTFRAIVAADIPTLNQNTSGTAAGLSATLAVASGGTGLTSTPANGALDIGNGTGFTRTTLTAGSGLAITNGSGSISIAASTIPVANGGTGQTSYTDGQLLIGNSTGNTLTKATLTAGSGVTITNASGAITIAASGGGGGGFSSWQIFTSSGTFTVPTGITKVKVTVVGGGGGGGALAAYDGVVGGGGGGGTAMEIISGLTPGGTVSVTVGAAGTAAAGGGNGGNGGPGGTSSFGAYCSATGGGGGIGSTAGNGFAAGGLGSGGDLNIRGGSGSFVQVGGGYGGASFFAGYTSPTVGVSTTGSPYGGGGGGAISQGCFAGGGAGTAGVVVVEY